MFAPPRTCLRLIALTVTATGLALSPSSWVAPARLASAQGLFLDVFEDGSVVDGSPVKWAPEVPPFPVGAAEVVDGSLVLTPKQEEFIPGFYETDWEALVETPADLIVRTQLRGIGTTGLSHHGIYARDTTDDDANQGVFVSTFVSSKGELYLARFQDGVSSFVKETFPELTPLTHDVHLELELLGSTANVFAWRDGSPRPIAPLLHSTEVGGDYLTPGRVGVLSSYQIGVDPILGAFRFVEAAPVPEPSGLLLSGLAAVGLALGRWRRWRRTS